MSTCSPVVFKINRYILTYTESESNFKCINTSNITPFKIVSMSISVEDVKDDIKIKNYIIIKDILWGLNQLKIWGLNY